MAVGDFVPGFNVEMQTTRKIMTVFDNSIGWNTPSYAINYFYEGNEYACYVKVDIAIETKNKLYSKSFYMTKSASQPSNIESASAFGTYEGDITNNADAKVLLAFLPKGEIVIVGNDTVVAEDYAVLPDGIYTIVYTVFSNYVGNPVESKQVFVVTNGADQVIIDHANAIADEILVKRDINVDDVTDYLLHEGMLYAASKAAFISRKNRVLNILDVINAV